MTLEEFLDDWNNDSDKLLVHTSGSTGKPKPMWVEKQKMLNSARITCDFLGMKPGDTFYLCMPLDYIAGKMVVARAIERHLKLISIKPSGHPLAKGQPFEFVDFSQPEVSIKHINYSPIEGWATFVAKAANGGEARGEAAIALVPLQVYNTLQVPEERERLMAIKHLIIGGGAIDDKMAKELKTFPNCVWSTYAMTETLSHIALRRINGPEASDWYTPFDSVSLSQTPDGCLIIDAPLVHDGKLVTNDRVEMRTDEKTGKTQFRVIGRKDNVIDSGGIKIQIEEVEAALKPFLKAPFAITKAKDEKFGEIVVLVTEADDKADVEEICINALPKYWRPRRYIHVDKVPMTETGKPARKQIEQLCSSKTTSTIKTTI